ncbi:lipid kinase YegS [Alcanivorax sp. S6407]|uniref:lipid kinase YegS n=1 Tax=Alcanivorax sp. S6407 TaxID=2926424 RepID=UPI001FF2E407|nr:lipid kinase YegS [Alcanivorax sp. S6407]
MSKCYWLILHGKQASHEALRQAIMARRDSGLDIQVRVTWEAGDAERLVREGLAAGARDFIAAGGDGSVRDIVNAMMASDRDDLSLAILPLGTANDLATAAGIPDDMDAALALLDNAPAPCDAISINDQYFLNMATGGFGTEVTTQTSEELKKLLGGAAYFLTGLSKFTEIQAAQGHFKGDDFDWQGEFLAVGLGNGRQAGGGQQLCPDALINDGLLDVAILPADMDLLAGVRELFDSEARQDPDQPGLFIRSRVRELLVETPSPMHFNLDGEPIEDTRFAIKVIHEGLSLYLPEGSPLLG